MTELIRFDNVSFAYDEEAPSQLAVRDVSFSVEKGSFVAVLGHNGSGKSTVAKLMNGMIKPTSGKVYVNGLDTSDPEYEMQIRRTVGMVSQNPDNQIVATVVDEDVAFGLENIGISQPEMVKKVDSALSAVNMTEFRFSAPSNLSGGQKQRIAIAGIIAMEPECIVLDEPTSMLDPAGRKDVIDTVVSLCRDHGITVVLITHFMHEALLADRIIVTEKGNIVMDGAPESVFSEVDTIKSMGLEVPVGKELLYELDKRGIKIDVSPLDEHACTDAIFRFWKRRSAK